MRNARTPYLISSICLSLFVAAQTFQDLAYRFWIPVPHSPREEMLVYLLPIDRVRAILVMFAIATLIVPFITVARRYYAEAPIISILGAIFGTAFVGFELTHRSIDFFVVGGIWAHQLVQSAAQGNAALEHFRIFSDVALGWFFPQMLSYLIASCAFAIAAMTECNKSRWHYLGPIGFGLNALRVLGRLLSTFAGISWLNGLNDRLYFLAVLTVYPILIVWFFLLARNTIETA